MFQQRLLYWDCSKTADTEGETLFLSHLTGQDKVTQEKSIQDCKLNSKDHSIAVMFLEQNQVLHCKCSRANWFIMVFNIKDWKNCACGGLKERDLNCAMIRSELGEFHNVFSLAAELRSRRLQFCHRPAGRLGKPFFLISAFVSFIYKMRLFFLCKLLWDLLIKKKMLNKN